MSLTGSGVLANRAGTVSFHLEGNMVSNLKTSLSTETQEDRSIVLSIIASVADSSGRMLKPALEFPDVNYLPAPRPLDHVFSNTKLFVWTPERYGITVVMQTRGSAPLRDGSQ